jgi:hypothetical protein
MIEKIRLFSRSGRAAGILFLLLLAPGARAENPFLSKAIQAYENFEYQIALDHLKQAASHPESDKAEKARVHIYLGLVRFTLGDKEAAEQEFEAALKLDFQAALPPDTSPKIVSCFEQVKQAVSPPEPVKPPGPDKPPPPPPPPPAPRPGKRLWTWVAAGVGAAALIGGGTFGYLASEAKSDFDREPWADKAAELKDTVESRSLTANILYGAGGAVMVAALVLFFTEPGLGSSRDASADAFEFSISPLGAEASFRF